MKGQFTFEDFLDQLRQVQKLGSMGDLLKMLPGRPRRQEPAEGDGRRDRRRRAEARRSHDLGMTPAERREPGIISGSRRLRIANGSGVTTADVNSLLKDFDGARKMMRTMMGGKRIPGMMRRCPRRSSRSGSRAARRRRKRNSMSTRIRLRRMGANKRPFYRVVVADQRSPARRPLHREHRQVPPARGPLADRDRRGARPALAARRRPALQPGPQPHGEDRASGTSSPQSVPPPPTRCGFVPTKPDEPKLSKKAAAKAAAAAEEAAAPPPGGGARRRGRAGRC